MLFCERNKELRLSETVEERQHECPTECPWLKHERSQLTEATSFLWALRLVWWSVTLSQRLVFMFWPVTVTWPRRHHGASLWRAAAGPRGRHRRRRPRSKRETGRRRTEDPAHPSRRRCEAAESLYCYCNLTCTHLCSPVLTCAHLCSYLFTCTHLCSYLLTCAHIYSPVPCVKASNHRKVWHFWKNLLIFISPLSSLYIKYDAPVTSWLA